MLDIVGQEEALWHPEPALSPGVQGPDVRPPTDCAVFVEQELPWHPANEHQFFWAGTLQQLPAGSRTIGYRPAPLGQLAPSTITQAASQMWARQIADVTNRNQQGKLNATLEIVITAHTGSTSVTDARISATSFIGFQPLTANAASEYAAGTLYTSSQTEGSATLSHANNGQSDRRYRLLIIG